jgi:Uri superfamily endonuclease
MARLADRPPHGFSRLSGMNTGTYALVLYLDHARMIRIGKLGSFIFPAGYYAYIGSAFGPGGLSARIQRHLGAEKNFHWHIDYLRQHTVLQEIWISQEKIKREHDWASLLEDHFDSSLPVPGFGCSDCTCTTHLFHFDAQPSFQRFSKANKRLSPGSPTLVRIRP